MLTLSDFDFDLPPELIAQIAPPDRIASRLPAVRRARDAMHFEDRQFADLVNYLRSDDLLVFNDTRVIKARSFGQKASGGKVEVLVRCPLDEHTVLTQIHSSKPPVESTILRLADALDVTVGPRTESPPTLRFPQPALGLIEQYDCLPLPPYIECDSNNFDETHCQTVYAHNPGAMAAPTVGLHFDDVLFAKLSVMGIQCGFLTLHVDMGMFQPVRVENIAEHRMHSEQYEITPELAEAIRATRAAGGHITVVGTTSMRVLESAAWSDGALNACSSETDIFIIPGYRSHVIDLLVANFRLPKLTLLILVSVPTDMSAIREAYQHAIIQRYHSPSYGDVMLLTHVPTESGEPGETQSF